MVDKQSKALAHMRIDVGHLLKIAEAWHENVIRAEQENKEMARKFNEAIMGQVPVEVLLQHGVVREEDLPEHVLKFYKKVEE